MKKYLIIIIAIIIGTTNYYSQEPIIYWENTIGGDLNDGLNELVETSDGGFIMGGYSLSDGYEDKSEDNIGLEDFWIVKVDYDGYMDWDNTIGGTGQDVMTSIIQTSDGGYLAGGYSNSNISADKSQNSFGGLDYWIVKLNAFGDVQWDRTYGGTDEDKLHSVVQTSDGGYFIGGRSGSGANGNKTDPGNGGWDYWVLKLDASGNIQWQNAIGGSSFELLFSVQQTSDGGYILGGHSLSNISGDKTENSLGGTDYWVVKLNASGAIQWNNTMGGSGTEGLYEIEQTMDGGYIVGGFSDSNSSADKSENSLGLNDYWIVKLSSSGTIVWEETIGGNQNDNLQSIEQMSNGEYVIAGYSNSDASFDKSSDALGDYDYWLVQIDASGNIEWDYTTGGTANDRAFSIHETSDDGIVVGGYSLSDNSDDKGEDQIGGEDYWIAVIYVEGEILGCTNAIACNYDPMATIDDGSCNLPDGCTNAGACNYDSTALCDDGTCEFVSCAGCMDTTACNFDSTAILDDGSCEYTSCNCLGDMNNDGEINSADLLIFLSDFGCIGVCIGDYNTDLMTNSADLLILLSVYGETCIVVGG